MEDYYKILQVSPDASPEVIQMAYKALAKKYHPDLNPGQEKAAQEKMKAVNEAYEVLSDKDKRWQYDQGFYRQSQTEPPPRRSEPDPSPNAQPRTEPSQNGQTDISPQNSTSGAKENTSGGKGCAKAGCGCLTILIVLFVLIGIFGGSSSSGDADEKSSVDLTAPAASVAASADEEEPEAGETQKVSQTELEQQTELQTEQLDYTMEQFEQYGELYTRTDNPYYIEASTRFVKMINYLYSDLASQKVSQTTLEQAMKDAGVSRIFIARLKGLQGEDMLKNGKIHRMDEKEKTGIVEAILGNETTNTYWEVSSKAKNAGSDSGTILYYYGDLKDNKPDGTGAMFSYTSQHGFGLSYVGKFKDGKKSGKGIDFYYDGFEYYIVSSGNHEKNYLTGKGITYHWRDCNAIETYYLFKFNEYIDQTLTNAGEKKLTQNLEILMKNNPAVELFMFAGEGPSTIVDLNASVIVPFVEYDGNFKSSDYHGKGKYYAASGELIYDGEWNHNHYDGKGTLYNNDGSIRKKGEFKDEAIDEAILLSTVEIQLLKIWDNLTLDQIFSTDTESGAGETAAQTSSSSQQTAEAQTQTGPSYDSVDPPDSTDSRQEILVEAKGSSATLTLWTYRDGQWVEDMSTTAAIGSNGLTTNKTEGDHMTPEGNFPICFAFSTKAKNTKIAFETIREDSVWVCDPESIYYNTLQSKNNPDKDWADKGGAENMYPKFTKGSSNACICFSFNGDGMSPYGAVAYGGSALFIDGVGENGKMNSGYGDVKISGKDMTKLLSYLDSDYNPTITIQAAQ